MSRPSRAAWLTEAVSAGKRFHYIKKHPLRHNLLNLGAAAAIPAGLALVLGSAAWLPTWAYLLLAPPLAGCLIFSIYILVLHECSHGMFIVSRDRRLGQRLNRWIGVAAAAPLFTDYLRHWERGHIRHHLNPCEPGRDPQAPNPADGPRYFRAVALLLFVPLYALRLNPSAAYPGRARRVALGFGFWALPIGWAAMNISGWVIVAWVWAYNWVMILNFIGQHCLGLPKSY